METTLVFNSSIAFRRLLLPAPLAPKMALNPNTVAWPHSPYLIYFGLSNSLFRSVFYNTAVQNQSPHGIVESGIMHVALAS